MNTKAMEAEKYDLPQSATGDSVAHNAVGEPSCDNTAIPKPVAEDSGTAVNPAISLAISPSTDENYTTESDGDKPSNQSGSQSKRLKPNCYECQYRRSIPGDAHSECVHPRLSEIDRIITGFALLSGQQSSAMKRLNISADSYGIKKGWFYWPLNFDPAWLETCNGFIDKAKEQA